MNKLLSIGCLVLLLGACTHKENLFTGAKERITNCLTSKSYEVPVRDGYATYVLYGEDTLAVATRPITIEIPNYTGPFTKGESDAGIRLDYELIASQPTYSQFFQAVMFEDTPNGDYDYNDLVLHIRNTSTYKWNDDYRTLKVDIQPIALGSQKKIKLGCVVVYDQSVHIISEDVRKDLFDNVSGFINTESAQQPVRYKFQTRLTHDGLAKENKSAALVWFIEVEGKRFFAVNGDLSYEDYDMLNQKNMPYGLVIFGTNGENGTFAYPEEKASVFQAYPGFKDWIDGKATTVGKKDKKFVYYYAHERKIPGEDGFLHTIWDYKDLE